MTNLWEKTIEAENIIIGEVSLYYQQIVNYSRTYYSASEPEEINYLANKKLDSGRQDQVSTVFL